MSTEVQTELDRIESNVAAAYAAAAEKGATIPEQKNSANLEATVRTIPNSSGGVSSWDDLGSPVRVGTVLEECNPEYDEEDGSFMAPSSVELIVGGTYIVKWNGVEYTCIGQDTSMLEPGSVCIGDCTIIDPDLFTGNGEPFVIFVIDGMFAMMPLDGSTSLTISIAGDIKTFNPIPSKYMPEGYPQYIPGGEVICTETSYTNGESIVAKDLTPGVNYQVTWNGAVYSCKAQTIVSSGVTAIGVGNLSVMGGMGNNEPFAIALVNGQTVVAAMDGTSTGTVSIVSEDSYIPMDPRFMPEDSSLNLVNGSAEDSLRTKNALKDGTSMGGVVYNIGKGAIAMGEDVWASGKYSVAMGHNAYASGEYSHAVNMGKASAEYAHAEGTGVASGVGSHAEGSGTASGRNAHAEGFRAQASGWASHAEGQETIANGEYQHVQGKYNVADSKYAHIVGSGKSDTERSNAHTIDWDGNAWFAGKIMVGGNGQDSSDAKRLLTEDDITGFGAVVIPDYWQTELDEGVDAINAALEQAGRNKSSFLWYHDSHWTNNSKMSPKLLKYLQAHTALNKVNYGGDIVSTEIAASRDDWEYLYEWRKAVRGLKNHHSVRGNHEDDIHGLKTDEAVYSFLMAAEETPDIVRGGDFYYYIDEPSENTRYLYLDTQVCTTLTNQGDPVAVEFVVDSLNSTPTNWHIVPIAHIWFLYDDYSTPKVGKIPNYCQQLLDIFDAYNARGNGSVTVAGTAINYDFANGSAKVEFCIGGHTHVDMDFTSNAGIPVILTEADQYETRGGYDATPGTTGESAIDAIIADYRYKKISVIRIGRGESREVPMGSGIVSYHNILDDVGYLTDTRVSASSGYAEKPATDTGVDLTGYIPIKFNEVLYFKNIQFPRTTSVGYGNYIYIYTGSKTGNGSGPITDFVGTGVWEAEWDSNNNITKLIYGGADGFIRFNAINIDDTSVITINEPIE